MSACSSGGGGGSSSPAGKKGGGKGSPTKPVALPGKLTEAPALAKQVKAGSLPPLSKRLPEKPYVVPHRWIERGQYGGTLNMPVFGTTGMANASSVKQFSYGFSPTRWLNDGLDIGPGLAERWSSNADTTVWTVSFRKGLRWSDGTLFSVDDIIFWYEDIATPGYDAQPVPQDCLSAKGTPCTMAKVDDSTLRITYDAPQPLVPDYLASWPKG
ncbi:MAG TPA: ABC transporter substrate-binding protein, partial [Mycobacteriales bacterium]|nr:ABC transporter substrate-binding protein [Mycobacteriales bacterium]